jgi:hypothetical protein
VAWYRVALDLTQDASATPALIALTSRQIAEYRRDAQAVNAPWQVASPPPVSEA